MNSSENILYYEKKKNKTLSVKPLVIIRLFTHRIKLKRIVDIGVLNIYG